MSLALDIERLELIRVLCRRGVRLHMEETLRETHKSPFVPAAMWEELRRAYDMMFPFPDECSHCGGPKGHPPFDWCSP